MSWDKVLVVVGQIAGIGGIAIGTFLLLSRELMRKAIFPRLSRPEGFRLLNRIVFYAWTIAILGILAWTATALFRPAPEPSESSGPHSGGPEISTTRVIRHDTVSSEED
jgi:hypothetical protein